MEREIESPVQGSAGINYVQVVDNPPRPQPAVTITSSSAAAPGEYWNKSIEYGDFVKLPESEAVARANKEYPATMAGFRQIQNEQYELFAKKMVDYSPANIMLGGNVDVELDRHGSLRGIVIRMNDKINRLITIIVKGNTANNESAMDSFIDLSVYGMIALLVNRQIWGK